MLASKVKNIGFCAIGALLLAVGCSKIEYAKVNDPAYLRVFNNLNYTIGIDNKDEQVPYLTMLIDPEMDKDGMPINAGIKGDFLGQREPYAPPYPSHIGSGTSVTNPEYPGRENVLVGPVLNGFDLSSWAQIPSGKHRVVFMYRPTNTVPFFQLENKLKHQVLIDTSIVLDTREVYTLHVLQKDFVSKRNGIYLRKENFHKLPLSDSLVYINFYNMSAKGYWEADKRYKTGNEASQALQFGIKDQMNIYYSLFRDKGMTGAVPGYRAKFLAALKRNSEVLEVSPYYSFPLFADGKSDGIYTSIWQRFDLVAPGMDLANNPYGVGSTATDCNWAPINCLQNGKFPLYYDGIHPDNGATLPNMIVNIHSGKYNPRSFATVNTIEVVNGRVYLTTIQRKYAPPIY